MKWRIRRMLGLGDKRQPEARGSHVAEVVWSRSEELRPDRLGPTQDDVENPEKVRVRDDPWRPRRTLGPL